MKKIILFLLIIVGLSSCRLFNPSLMLKTPRNYQYSQMKDSVANVEYKISANDIIEMRLYSNDGFRLTEVTNVTSSNSTTTTQNVNQSSVPYTIDIDGNAKLPVIGKTALKGLTIRQAEHMLEEKYSLYYIRPFIMLKVTSKRIIVFPGEGGAGKVIPLDHNNTTLIEGLALAGGVSTNGKAYQIKLIRRINDKSEVYHIDLSTINGLNQANLVLQANDIIYVEPRIRISQSIVNEITPVISLISSLLVFYALFNLNHQ